MKINEDLKKNLILITFTVFLILIVMNVSTILLYASQVLQVLKPVIYGLFIAFILNIVLVRIEKILKLKMKKPRGLSLVLTLVIFIAAIYAVVTLIVPELIDSIVILVKSIPTYWENAQGYILDVIGRFNITEEAIYALPWKDWTQNAINFLLGVFPAIFSSGTAVASTIMNIFLGIIIAIYMLASKEKLIDQFTRVLYSFLPKKFCDKLMEISTLSNDILNKFATGQLLEAVILGTLCFVGLFILKIPYAPLIAVIIGLTNIIPYFGPIIGTVPSAFLILMVSPVSALIFVVFILILQQIDSNIIYPRVVGESVSLPAMWIMIAILIGGGMFGLVGMLLGVPVFAIIYSVMGTFINKRYKQRIEK